MFTRGSKRTKTAPVPPEPVAAPEPAPLASTKRGRKPKERDDEAERSEKKPRGRAMDFSTPKTPSDTIIVPKKRKTTRSSTGKVYHDKSTVDSTALEATDYDSIDLVGSTIVNDTANGAIDTSNQPTIITLPFSDTPVINRNKEMRKQNKGTRRSSLGLRGRRASSLIENGHSAIPHREVEASEFYKHIEADGLSEPRRMKQLLTWTGERELGEKPSHGEANDLSEQAGTLPKSGREALMLTCHHSSHY
jgi:kinetochore protein Mis13/DSN1